MNNLVVIAIDGPSASGKGTIARRIATNYEYNYLNSGALYRLVAWQAKKLDIDFKNIVEIANLGRSISPIFLDEKIIINGVDVWPEISKEEVGKWAAEISPYPELRDAIMELQRKQEQTPGLVAEGRDMCSEVFPWAQIKIFLDVKPEVSAARRYNDELAKGLNPDLAKLTEMMQKRDHSDRNRERGALRLMPDAHYIDTSNMSREEVYSAALTYCEEKMQEMRELKIKAESETPTENKNTTQDTAGPKMR